MFVNMLKGKIHRATVTEANLNYVGSITVDSSLMEAAGILDGERVQVVNVNNGERLETYVIKGAENSGMICLNGAAARLVQKDDKVIIMAYCWLDDKELYSFQPKVVFVDDENKIFDISDKEEHGEIIC